MRTSMLEVVWILAVISISRNVNTVDNSVADDEKEKASVGDSQLVKISYISKPSVSAIDVSCRTHVAALDFRIVCPALDDAPDVKKSESLNVAGECNLNDEYWQARGCSHSRRIPSKQIEHLANFTCYCWVKQALKDGRSKATVEIINDGSEKSPKTVFRRIDEKKNIRLPCSITGYPPPKITWFKNKRPLNRSAETVIKNVRYKQKRRSLVISRTDVSGSGVYQSLARNTAGTEWGRIYQVEFYEARRISMNESKRRNKTTTNHFTVVHDIGTTKMTNFPSIDITSQSTFIVPEFIRNTNGSANNKEEAEDKSKNEENIDNKTILLALICVAIILSVGLGILIHFRKARRAPMGADNRQSGLVNCCRTNEDFSWPTVHSTDCNKRVPDDSINCKLVDMLDVIDESEYFPYKPPGGSKFRKYPIYALSSSSFERSTSQNPEITSILDPLHIGILSLCNDRTSPKQRDVLESTGSSTWSQSLPNQYTFSPISDPFTDSELSFDATINKRCSQVLTKNCGQSSAIPSPVISTSSKTSALLNRLITIPPNADQRYIASALIDHTGGEVALPGTGIRLVIPEGALDFGTAEVIQIALAGNSDFVPKQYKASMLTPVVMCGPHGLHFKKHVLLILPHCLVVGDESEREFKVLCSDTAPDVDPDWKEVFDASEEEQKDVFCHMGKQHFSLFVQHFSWYAIKGRGRAKNFKLAAYHTSFHQTNEDFKVRFYFIPSIKNSTISQEEVEKCEKKLKGTLCDGEKTKLFYEDGGDIKVKACEVNEGWKIRGENTQIGGYEELCQCHEAAASPNLTFVFQHVDKRPEQIFCKFTACQDACKFDNPVDITLSVHFKAEIKRAQMEQKNSPPGIPSVSSSGYAGSGENTHVAFIPTRLRKDLKELLDIEIDGTKNYKMLAERLGYKFQFIRWLESSQIQSPTDTLLMTWESDQGDRSPKDALRHLQEKLLEMKRLDAVEKIQECFDEFLIGKETTV